MIQWKNQLHNTTTQPIEEGGSVALTSNEYGLDERYPQILRRRSSLSSVRFQFNDFQFHVLFQWNYTFSHMMKGAARRYDA